MKSVPYRTKGGDIFQIPGAWSISMKTADDEEAELSGRGYRRSSRRPSFPNEEDEERSDDEDENDTDTESDGLGERRSSCSASTSDRFVVRNEFGHARIQQFIRQLEMNADMSSSHVTHTPLVHQHSFIASHSHHPATPPADATAVGGHCTLPMEVFETCLVNGWGWKHPFGGQYHPITGTVIPETTLLYPSPRNEEELEIVWKIVHLSYEWAKAAAMEEEHIASSPVSTPDQDTH